MSETLTNYPAYTIKVTVTTPSGKTENAWTRFKTLGPFTYVVFSNDDRSATPVHSTRVTDGWK